jgi:ATP-binding cassette, subfamily G (WHITE), member 2, PDR
VAFLITYCLAAELNSSPSRQVGTLVFRRGHVPKVLDNGAIITDLSSTGRSQKKSMHVTEIAPARGLVWRNVCYDIKAGDHSKRLLNNVSGFAKPGYLTALMGVSGAGKTTLLNTLAQRHSTGIISGELMLNGDLLGSKFRRQIGMSNRLITMN